LSSRTLNYAAGIIRRHRKSIGFLWRKLNPGQQALLVLAYLRKGDTFAQLAAGFGVGTTTAWRYVEETVALLADRAPKLRKAVRDAKRAGHAYVVVDGTLIPIDRVAADRPVAGRDAAQLYVSFDWRASTTIDELHTLASTVETWRPEIEAFLDTGITNAKTEGLNRPLKQVKRSGCGFRNVQKQHRRVRFHCTRRNREATAGSRPLLGELRRASMATRTAEVWLGVLRPASADDRGETLAVNRQRIGRNVRRRRSDALPTAAERLG
jgi:hypothetical protein